MTKRSFFTRTAKLFNLLGKPIRLQILAAIGRGEACVCHLESVLKTRQAYISQQLMALRKAGLLKTRRDGKYVFYRLSDVSLLELVNETAKMMGINPEDMPTSDYPVQVPGCCCPYCVKETVTIPMKSVN